MFNITLWGGKGNRVAAAVTEDQELSVINAPYPPLSPQKSRPLRQYLTVDGLPDSLNNMGVDGSVTNVDYYISADPSVDRYITTLNFVVGYSTTGQPNEWADGTALTNGSRLFYSSQRGEVNIHEGIKSNQDLFRLIFTSVAANWEVRHVNANNDYGYFATLNLRELGLPYGIKLDRGTNQKLAITIRDNAGTSADTFNCIAYGFDRFE
jgi:hypothetical protein